MIQLALFEPEIPQNTGTLIRLCACFDITLHIIEPCGFLWKSKKLNRSVMDYEELCVIQKHASFEHFEQFIINNHKQIIAIDVQGKQSCWDFSYKDHHVLLMGKESAGLPIHVQNRIQEKLFIPQKKGRSLNLAIAASIVLSEGVRQLSVC